MIDPIVRYMSNCSIKDNYLAEMFKALSNVHRLALFQRLTSCCVPGTRCQPDEMARFCVGDLGEGMNIAPSTLSHHLKELTRAGLVKTEKRGKYVECWVDPEVLHSLSLFFQTSK